MTEKKKLLLVDDQPVNLKLARNILMNQYDVFTVTSAEKMMEFLNKILPDLILLDVMMPGIDGYKAIRWLKRDQALANIPVIFLTSKTDVDSELEGLSLGAVDYIYKPFSPSLLLKRVELHIMLETQKHVLKNWNDELQRKVDAKTRAVVNLQDAVLKTISNLVECRDDVTGGHVERTERFLRLLVSGMQKLGVYNEVLSTWDRDLIGKSAQLHDVGKISISDSILLKPGKLSTEEFEEMKKHTVFGETIIEKIQEGVEESMFLAHAKIMAGTHHEKWNGRGYPRGLANSSIPLQGRIMAIVDVYDALVCERPYKKAFSHQDAVRIIGEERGAHFDPAIVDVFLHESNAFNDLHMYYSQS